MAIKNYYAGNALTGGVDGALDSIATGTLITPLVPDESQCIVNTGTVNYTYTFDLNSTAPESSPDVIKPNSGVGAWYLTIGASLEKVGSISLLKARSVAVRGDGDSVMVETYATPSDGGQGM
ncbi:unnamed protein product, partial [marine sediment metagenome]